MLGASVDLTLLCNNLSPDIVMANIYGHFSYQITPGNLTISDHLPVILDISTNPSRDLTIKILIGINTKMLENKPSSDLNGKSIKAKQVSIPQKTYRINPYTSNTSEL